MNWTKSHDIALLAAMLVTMLLLAYMSMFYIVLPFDVPGWHAPIAFRIFFFHIPLAWTAYLSFGIVFVASVAYLRTRKPKWDVVAACSAEVGVLLTTLALLTGSLWGKAEQDYYWRWEDARLFSTFILWMAYVAYLALRAGVRGDAKARVSAVFGIISFVFVPLSYISSRSPTSLHPTTPGFFPPQNAITLLVGVVALTLLFFCLLRVRIYQENLRAQLEIIKEEMEESN